MSDLKSIECLLNSVMHFSSEKFKGCLFLSVQMIFKSSELYLSDIFILFAIIYLINHSELGGQMIEILSHLSPSSPSASKLIYLFNASALIMIQIIVYLIFAEWESFIFKFQTNWFATCPMKICLFSA